MKKFLLKLNYISLLVGIMLLNGLSCNEPLKKIRMKEITPQKNMSDDQGKGSVRNGNVIKAMDDGVSFKVPDAWLKWYQENEAHPNLHLTPKELDAVRDATGEWDKEFAMITNTILPFNECVAHAGAEGWGSKGLGFADLQIRVYVMEIMPEEIEKIAYSKGYSIVSTITESPANIKVEQAGLWKRIVFEYSRTYHDYSAKAKVDMRVRRINNKSVVFVFMYTDHADHTNEINGILDSVKMDKGS